MYARFDPETKEVIKCDTYADAAKTFEPNGPHLAVDFVGNHCVSTIFLTLEHNNGCHFESYVFEADGKEITNYCEVAGRRARTYEEVMEYHKDYVDHLRSGHVPGYGDGGFRWAINPE